VASWLLAGCENHLCDPTSTTWGLTAGQGEQDPDFQDAWESSPIEGTWAPFPAMVTETFDVSSVFPSCPTPMLDTPQLSPDPMPTVAGSNYAWAAGNLAEVVGMGPTSVTIFNDSCADYYVRVVIHCGLPGALDGGARDGD
jgi:hypothetical protein